MEELRGTEEMTVNLIDLIKYTNGLTLADEPTPASGRLTIIDYVVSKVRHRHDLHRNWVEVLATDFMPVPGDESFAWEVTIVWVVYCDECDWTAIDQTNYDSLLCQQHYLEALKQDQADNDNDDRAIGLIE